MPSAVWFVAGMGYFIAFLAFICITMTCCICCLFSNQMAKKDDQGKDGANEANSSKATFKISPMSNSDLESGEVDSGTHSSKNRDGLIIDSKANEDASGSGHGYSSAMNDSTSKMVKKEDMTQTLSPPNRNFKVEDMSPFTRIVNEE